MKFIFCIVLAVPLFVLDSCENSHMPVVEPEPRPVDFLSRPASEPLYIEDQSNIKISNLSFRNIDDRAIVIQNCQNIEITECDFADTGGGILVGRSKNVTITWNRFSNIGENYIQLTETSGGYIAHNKGKGGNTGDMISIFKSGGSSESDPLVIEYNHFEGDGWESDSGSGIMLGDYGGQHTIARYNTLLSPGQVGIGIASGVDMHVTGNTVYGAKMPKSNVGIYVWNQSETPIGDIEISENKVRWYREDGYENPYWNGEDFTPAGETTNDWYADIDIEKIKVCL